MGISIPVEAIRHVADPLAVSPWDSVKKPISVEEVLRAVKQKHIHGGTKCLTRQDHVRRIAFFVECGWLDPIDIDVGVRGYWPWPIADGNHRLAAAIVRGDREILVEIDGDLDYASELFGVDVAGAYDEEKAG